MLGKESIPYYIRSIHGLSEMEHRILSCLFYPKGFEGACPSTKAISEAYGFESARVLRSMKRMMASGLLNKRGGRFHIVWENLPRGPMLCATEKDSMAAAVSMPYRKYLKTDHWRSLREDVLRLSFRMCCKCGRRDRLHVHHRSYARLGCELLEDLTVLCYKCHHKEHEPV